MIRPTNYLARARAYLDAGRADLAEEYARRATEANEENGEAFHLLGILLHRRGESAGAARALLRASSLRPEDALAREHLARTLGSGFPTGLEEGLFRLLPGAWTEGELTLRDTRLGTTVPSSRRWAVVIAAARDAGSARDPKYRGAFGHVAYAYVQQERPTRWFRVATVRFRAASDGPLARRVAGLIAQLFWVRREYLGAAPDFPSPLEASVWLTRDGRAGGEEWNGALYLYNVTHPRSPEEWVRQVIHEYGHVALPGDPIYRRPEPKSNGYLAERLLATWLGRNQETAWEGAVDLHRYLARRAVPLRQRFLQEGPRSALAASRDSAGMDYYIGAVLGWEALHGPRLVRAAFGRAGGKGAESFLRACQGALESAASRGFEIDRDALIEDGEGSENRSAVWIYLPAGRWRLEIETGHRGALRARWDGRPLHATADGSQAVLSIGTTTAGWRRLELSSRRVGVRRLAFLRSPVVTSLSKSGAAGSQAGAMSISRSWPSAWRSSRETCICEIPRCWATSACDSSSKKRSWMI